MPAMNRPLRVGAPLATFRLTCVAVAAAGLGGAAQAQDGPAPTSRLVPTLTVSESVLRGGVGSGNAGKTEFITRVSPGLSWTSRSGRVQGSVNYVLDASLYSRRSDASQLSNTLLANVVTTVVDKRAFVDVQANAGQTSISPFGQQSGNDTFRDNANRTEFFNARVSPYVVGSLAGIADYSLRVTAAVNTARNYSAANTTGLSGLASLRSSNSGALVGWGLSAQRSDTEFKNSRTISTERVTAELNARPFSDLLVFATGGKERTNALDLNGGSYNNWGGGLRWVPSVRTNVSLAGEKRYFGNSFTVLFEHRTPQTVWRYLDTQNTTDTAGPTALTTGLTLFQLLFQQFASTVPDPIAREQLVRDLLRSTGRNADEVVGAGALISALSLQRRQEISAAWVGRRATLSLLAYALDLEPLDPDAARATTLTLSRVRQTGATASVSYRLTPVMSVTATGSRQITGSSGLRAGNRLNSLALGLTTQLNRQTAFGLNVRYADFSSPTDPYREALVTATLNFRF